MSEKISERAAEEVAVKVMSFRGARGNRKALELFERETRTLRNLVGARSSSSSSIGRGCGGLTRGHPPRLGWRGGGEEEEKNG